jgi:hypothetical protein
MRGGGGGVCPCTGGLELETYQPSPSGGSVLSRRVWVRRARIGRRVHTVLLSLPIVRTLDVLLVLAVRRC